MSDQTPERVTRYWVNDLDLRDTPPFNSSNWSVAILAKDFDALLAAYQAVCRERDTLKGLMENDTKANVLQDQVHELTRERDALQARVAALETALVLVRTIGNNLLKRKFDHCGAMNATQLGDRDTVLSMLKKVEQALTPGAGEES